MSTEIRQTEVNLDGLLEVLGENLYSTPIVSIRELIQNAHDACVRRNIETGWDEKPVIHIQTDWENKRIEITDNGSGLTKEEIISYLATIGSGYTRILRESTKNEDAVGYFGLGFLTAYVVADNVEFITTSYQDEKQAWRFASKGGQRYQLKSTTPSEIGSTVVLHLKETFEVLADSEFIHAIIKKYCCLLPIDIYLNTSFDNTDDEPVNRIEVPWRLPQEYPKLRMQKSSLAFAEVFDNSFEPLITFPIMGTQECPVNGLLWIQDGAHYATSDNRVTTIFVRSMHITDECKLLLPRWAGFVGCVIDTPLLKPTASRESVQEDEGFEKIRQLINDILVEALIETAQESGPIWRRISSRHNESLLGAAISDEQLFDAMHQQLSIPTSEGDLKINEILQRSNNNEIRLSLDNQGGYEQLISKSLGIPIIHGYRYAVTSFCRLLTKAMGIRLLTLGTSDGNEVFFPSYAVDPKIEADLQTHFHIENAKIIISNYEPDCLPLLQVFDQDALLKKRIESDELDKHIGSATMMLARSFTEQIDVICESYLYINYGNALIKDFYQLDTTQKSTLASTLITITQLLTGHQSGNTMTSSSINTNNIKMIESLNANLIKLVKGAI